MEIRRATAADAEAIGRVWHEAWLDGHLGHVPEALVAERGAAQFVTRARARAEATWVAESAGVVQGFVTVKGDELEQIFVARAARGSGVAERLLRRGEAAIRAAGHRRAWLAVVAGNARARAFYEKLGWHDEGDLAYEAETAAGTLTVPCRRYAIALGEPSPAA